MHSFKVILKTIICKSMAGSSSKVFVEPIIVTIKSSTNKQLMFMFTNMFVKQNDCYGNTVNVMQSKWQKKNDCICIQWMHWRHSFNTFNALSQLIEDAVNANSTHGVNGCILDLWCNRKQRSSGSIPASKDSTWTHQSWGWWQRAWWFCLQRWSNLQSSIRQSYARFLPTSSFNLL